MRYFRTIVGHCLACFYVVVYYSTEEFSKFTQLRKTEAGFAPEVVYIGNRKVAWMSLKDGDFSHSNMVLILKVICTKPLS